MGSSGDGVNPMQETLSDSTIYSKLSKKHICLSLRRLLCLIANPFAAIPVSDYLISKICSQKSSRTLERSKGKRKHRKLLNYFAFFAVGMVIGFTAILSKNASENLSSKEPSFSFQDINLAGNVEGNLLRNEVSLLERSASEVSSSKKLERQSESVNVNETIKPLKTPPSDLDPELVSRKLLIVVTPTYPRPFQAYYLNRLAYTLQNIPPPLLWLVVEMYWASPETAKILRDSGVMFRNMVSYANTTVMNRSIHQRNLALTHIENYQLDGIVYFADDDGVYSTELFEKLREIRRFGTWPVATLSKGKRRVIVEGPICKSHEVIGWHSGDRRTRARRFHSNILGFAFNSTIIWDRKRWPRPTSEPVRMREMVFRGVQETSTFIEQLVEDESQMEGLPENCSKILVWNHYLEAPKLIYPQGWLVPDNLEAKAPLT